MRALSTPLSTHLAATNAYLMADLYTVRLGGRDGSTVLYWTSADQSIVYGGNTFVALPGIERSALRQAMDLEVDALEVTLNVASGTTLIGGLPIQRAVIDGRLDGAYVTVERAWLTSWASAPVGAVVLFKGTAAAKVSSLTVSLTVKSEAANLGRPVPVCTYQPQCSYQVYAAGCDLVVANFTEATTAAAGSTAGVLNHPGTLTRTPNAGAVITFTSGTNSGLKRVVRSYAAGVVTLMAPFPRVPAVGDAFTVTLACDKTKATCLGTFSNLARFRGFTDIPKAKA